MLKLLIIFILSSHLSYAHSCYESLLNGGYDSSHFRFYAESIDQEYSGLDVISVETIIGHLFKSLKCSKKDSKVYNIICTDALGKGFNVCSVDSRFGFFYITEDYMQNVHIIFNRWD